MNVPREQIFTTVVKEAYIAIQGYFIDLLVNTETNKVSYRVRTAGNHKEYYNTLDEAVFALNTLMLNNDETETINII